jgi:hypothetical protein
MPRSNSYKLSVARQVHNPGIGHSEPATSAVHSANASSVNAVAIRRADRFGVEFVVAAAHVLQERGRVTAARGCGAERRHPSSQNESCRRKKAGRSSSVMAASSGMPFAARRARHAEASTPAPRIRCGTRGCRPVARTRSRPARRRSSERAIARR